MRAIPGGFHETAEIAAEVTSATWRRFLRGPVGSIGIVRWVGAWAAYASLAVLAVTAAIRERPHQVTLWCLLLLAWLVSNVSSAAREQKRHDPKAWLYVAIVFLISGMAVSFAWYSVGVILLLAAAIDSRPVEWAAIVVRRVAGWATAALAWLGAWALLTNVSLAAVEPMTRIMNPRGSSTLGTVLSAVLALLSAGTVLVVLWLLVRRFRWIREQ